MWRLSFVMLQGCGLGGWDVWYLIPHAPGWRFTGVRCLISHVASACTVNRGEMMWSRSSGVPMEQYIVLDFTVMQPRKRRPGMITALLLIKPELTPLLEYQGHLYHVLFSENYRNVEVIDASDLSTFDHFVLLEEELDVTARSS